MVIHPLVLLSTVDHYNRLNAGVVAGKRVVGVLLGTSLKGILQLCTQQGRESLHHVGCTERPDTWTHAFLGIDGLVSMG